MKLSYDELRGHIVTPRILLTSRNALSVRHHEVLALGWLNNGIRRIWSGRHEPAAVG